MRVKYTYYILEILMSKPLETAIIKTPSKKMSYSEQQILEIARCADPDTGPMYFLDNYFCDKFYIFLCVPNSNFLDKLFFFQ